MKKLTISNAQFRYLETSFREWLDVLGYAPSSVYGMPNMIRELLSYLEAENIRNITELKPETIETYFERLKGRSNQRRGGGLSGAHLNKHLQALRKFTEYLRKTGRSEPGKIELKREEPCQKIVYLTQEEIGQLYKMTYEAPISTRNIRAGVRAAIRSRDRAMLTVCYGCGLRRNEAVHLDVGDINFDRSMLHVRKGKNYKERFVPISRTSRKHLTEYIYDHRDELLKGNQSPALFIGHKLGKRMQGQSLNKRLKHLQSYTSHAAEKEIGLHTLRHSIATHLLSAGMKVESISRFLGHSSLESTQVYTHLLADHEKKL